MKFPRPILETLVNKGIETPTPIQIQGLPVGLSGRDMNGIAFTGSGKTLVFTLPMIMGALEEEMKVPIVSGEGPFALLLCPSRELANQTYEIIEQFTEALAKDGYPKLKTLLCIGGVAFRDQENLVRGGIHMVVATPGRLIHMLQNKKFTLNFCKHFVLDEAGTFLYFSKGYFGGVTTKNKLKNFLYV